MGPWKFSLKFTEYSESTSLSREVAHCCCGVPFSKVAVVTWTKREISEINTLSREFCFPEYIHLPTYSVAPLLHCFWNW